LDASSNEEVKKRARSLGKCCRARKLKRGVFVFACILRRLEGRLDEDGIFERQNARVA
jgi:hypothetical protein